MQLKLLAPDELDQYLERHNCRLVDLRNCKQFEGTHIRNAINIPYAQLERNLQQFSKQIPIVLYCDRGGASLAACKRLSELGYEALSVMGGLNSYRGRYLEKNKKAH